MQSAKRYLINEIFYSLQGEGYYVGTPSQFVRFAGCNLRCPFCDTDHTEGQWMTLQEICQKAAECPARHVVLTGGEPSLQADDALVEALHGLGKYVTMETNGTHAVPPTLDWITLSPKDTYTEGAQLRLSRCDELKVIFDGQTPHNYPTLTASHHYLQPCDTGSAKQNQEILRAAIDFCKTHPQWRLSLQTHKLIGIQ